MRSILLHWLFFLFVIARPESLIESLFNGIKAQFQRHECRSTAFCIINTKKRRLQGRRNERNGSKFSSEIKVEQIDFNRSKSIPEYTWWAHFTFPSKSISTQASPCLLSLSSSRPDTEFSRCCNWKKVKHSTKVKHSE